MLDWMWPVRDSQLPLRSTTQALTEKVLAELEEEDASEGNVG